jgi:hypothetical protein
MTQETEILLNLFFRLSGAKTLVLVVRPHRDEFLSRNEYRCHCLSIKMGLRIEGMTLKL